MKKVDFLIVYEVKVRELENLCLLKYELERRGYTVVFINTWYYLNRKLPKYNANVVISFALYNDGTFKFISSYVKKFSKIINMQWEQVGTMSDEKSEKSQFFLKGIASNAAHICWGERTKNRLIHKCGIDERRLMLTGHVSLDFFRDNLVSYYRPKEEILRKYNLPLNKKICLFISSFSYVDLPAKIVNDAPDIGYSLDQFISVSNASQEEILKWMTLILLKNKDVIYIYRPHPAESNNKKLIDLTNKYSNFFVISDLSVKQWILVCDVIYTWYSTSLAEIHASGKNCYILRPIPIPQDRDLAICEGATFITDFASFESTLEENESPFPIREDILSQYYFVDNNEPTYKKICDSFIEVYKDDYFVLPKLNSSQRLSFKEKLRKYISRSYINNLISYISYNTKINIPILKRRRENRINGYNSYVNDLVLRNYASEEEINEIVERIKIALEKGI